MLLIMSRLELFFSKLCGKFVFGFNWTNVHNDIFFFLILILVFVSRMLVCYFWQGKRSPVWTAQIFTAFVAVTTTFGSSEIGHTAGQEQHENPGAAGSGASTPSSSFFRGLSGQIPAAPDSPGEVQQPEQEPYLHLGDLPEVPMEHIWEAPAPAG